MINYGFVASRYSKTDYNTAHMQSRWFLKPCVS